MTPLNAGSIRGNWATLLTAWNTDGSLDLGRLRNEIDVLIAMGVDGIYSHGTAGEFHSQSDEEFTAVSAVLAEACEAAGMPFQIGVSHMSAQISLGRLRRIRDMRPGAVQLILPDWFPLTDEEAVSFLSRMQDEARGLPLVLYNPPHAKRVLTPRDMVELARQVPSLAGWKTAGGDDAWYADMRRLTGRLSVFVPGHHLASGIRKGASGAYSNVACLHPAAAQEWADLAVSDSPAAMELEERLRAFMENHIAPFIHKLGFSNAACDRLLALIGGWADVGTEMRWPYRSIPAAEARRLRDVVRTDLPEFIRN